MLAMLGESVFRLASDLVKSNDGSAIAIQTAKGAYTCGEVVQGVVVLQNNSPRAVTRVLVRVTVQERVYWDEEIARTVQEEMPEHVRNSISMRIRSEGGSDEEKVAKIMSATNEWMAQHRKTVYEHAERSGFAAHADDLVVVSTLPHMLAPGNYSFVGRARCLPRRPRVVRSTRARPSFLPPSSAVTRSRTRSARTSPAARSTTRRRTRRTRGGARWGGATRCTAR